MKRGALALTAGLAVTLFMGAGGNKPEVLDEIRVKKLIVEDDAGTVRCLVEANDAGPTKFVMSDSRGTRRVSLSVNKNGRSVGFSLFQSDGRLRLGSGCADGGAAWVNLLHPRGPKGRVARGMASQ